MTKTQDLWIVDVTYKSCWTTLKKGLSYRFVCKPFGYIATVVKMPYADSWYWQIGFGQNGVPMDRGYASTKREAKEKVIECFRELVCTNA